MSRMPRWLVGRVIPVATAIYILAGTKDYSGRTGDTSILYFAAIVTAGVTVSALIPFFKPITTQAASRQSSRYAAGCLLVATVACLGAAVVSSTQGEQHPAVPILYVALVVLGVVNVVGVRLGARNYRDEIRPPSGP